MADDLFIAFDNFDNFFQISEHKILPSSKSVRNLRWNDIPGMLPTVEERHEMLDGRSERKTTLVNKIHFVSFISSSTTIWKWRTALISLALSPVGVGKSA